MTDEQVNSLVNAIYELIDVLKEIRDIQDSWESDEEIDLDKPDKYIL